MNVKKKSQLQEKQVAKDLSAEVVIASGALWGSKGDVRSDKFLVECKTTDKSYYTLSVPTWQKIEKEAVKDGLRIPVMCIELKPANSTDKCKFALIRYLDMAGLNSHSCSEITEGLPLHFCHGKSVRITRPEFIVFTAGTVKKNNSENFAVVSWEDFLYLLKGASYE